MDEKKRIWDLAKQTLSFAASKEMEERRKLWSAHNSLRFTRPLIYIRAIPFDEFLQPYELQCTTPYNRSLEKYFLLNQYRMELDDDYIIEPFLVQRAVIKSADGGVFGLPADLGEKKPGNSAAYQPSILEEEDFGKLQVRDYEVDEEATRKQYEPLADLLGDILPVQLDRQGILCSMWNNDISTLLAKLRGLEQIMWDIYDRPEWLHRLISYMQEKILLQMKQTAAAGGFRLVNHQNQAMPYAENLAAPQTGERSVSPGELWGFMAAQEFTPIGPDMFKEFMFDYQKPILEQYALAAYGCCEDLTFKIPILKSLPNLRRIAVSPFADRKRCAEEIGGDYIISWRPDPSGAVSRGVDENFVRSDLREAFDVFDANGCKFDITLKDVETVSGDRQAIVKWTKIVREEINRRYC